MSIYISAFCYVKLYTYMLNTRPYKLVTLHTIEGHVINLRTQKQNTFLIHVMVKILSVMECKTQKIFEEQCVHIIFWAWELLAYLHAFDLICLGSVYL